MAKRSAHDIDESAGGPRRDKQPMHLVVCGGKGEGKTTLVTRWMQGAGSQRSTVTREDESVWHAFETEHRNFDVAEATGDDAGLNALAAAAAVADLAVIVIDAGKGLTAQTRHHSRIVSMMGIRHVALAVNKMDAVRYQVAVFDEIVAEYRHFASGLGFAEIEAVPMSAQDGDNVLHAGTHMPWYSGLTLTKIIDTVDVPRKEARGAFRMPVQSVQPSHGELGLQGRIVQGAIRCGDAVRVLPSGERTHVKTIVCEAGKVDHADAASGIATLTLAGNIGANRGTVLAAADEPPETADQFEARLLWFAGHPMTPGRQYLIRLSCQEATATITHIKFCVDIDTGAHLAAKTVGMSEIAVVNLSTGVPLVFEPGEVNRKLGHFVLVDKLSLETVGAGSIDFALRRASNIHWQALEINKQARATLKQQQPCCIWFTGLSGSGKSTISNILEKRLHAEGRHTYVLDGDNVRHGLNRDLGFTEADRVENIRRVAEVAKLMVDAGLIVLVSFISPFRSERDMARGLFASGEFIEVFVDTPLEECERRDVKGLYAKARRGELKNFTGLDSDYEAPEKPEVHLYPARFAPTDCVEQVLQCLHAE